jgi:cap1 methyltransferase
MNLSKTSITFSNKNSQPTEINLFFSNKNIDPFFCDDLCELVAYYKGFIDKVENFKKWDYAKKISNPFELINQGGNKGISGINPISRSYFKLLELVNDFNLINEKETCNYAALAEGPGGFVECFIRYRKKMFLGRNDVIQCMTLKSDSNDIPNWNKAYDIFKQNKVNITYGEDGTGNLYNYKNIVQFSKDLNGKLVDLVTADGGFDYSVNFNQQEQMSSRLIFAEMVCAFHVSDIGAHFVLKIFDIYTILTIKILYLLTLYYDEVIITKPHTSRPANSEKYVVCKGFKGIRQNMKSQLLSILDEWENIGKNKIVSDISGIIVPNKFIESIYTLNKTYAKMQITNILKTIVFIEMELDNKDLSYLKKCQSIYALEWCRKYNNPINHSGIHIY